MNLIDLGDTNEIASFDESDYSRAFHASVVIPWRDQQTKHYLSPKSHHAQDPRRSILERNNTQLEFAASYLTVLAESY